MNINKDIPNLTFHRLLVAVVMCLIALPSMAQLDTKHYIPPMFGNEDLGDHYLVLGTPVSNSFNVTVKDGAGTVLFTIPISSSNSNTTQIGSDLQSPFLVSQGQLNSVLSVGKGLILTANEPFYASIRVIAGSQAGSLTSKGAKAALGMDFRTGHMYNNTGYIDGKSNVISFMATEDNTTVTISDIKPGVLLKNAPSSGNPATTNDISVVLDAGESYVVAALMNEANATNNVNGMNGTHITSDKNIVVNCGTWLGGNSIDGTSPNDPVLQGRDIGIDQIVSIDNIGDEYVLIRGFGIDNERTIVVASEDNTAIYLGGSATPIAILNEGQYGVIDGTAFSTNDNLYLQSSAAVYVTQTLNGGDGWTDDTERQAGINFLPPVKCTGAKEVTIPNASFIGTAYINIIADAGANVQVNGNSIGSGSSIPGTSDYVTYQVSGYNGDVTITSDKLIRVALLNLNGNIGAAGYFSGFSKDFNLTASYANNGYVVNEEISEGCGIATITIERSNFAASTQETILLDVQGSAQEGIDYSYIPDQLSFPIGVTTLSFDVEAFSDLLTEGDESVFVTITLDGDICGQDELEFVIKDVEELNVTLDDSNVLCPGDDINLAAIVSGGVEPYEYNWSTAETSPSINVNPTSTQTYSVTVTDVCAVDTVHASSIIEVPIYELIIFHTNDTAVLCPYTDMVVAAEASGGLGPYEYHWYQNGTYILNGPMLAAAPPVTTEYTVVVTDQCGLESSETVLITVITPLMVLTPSADKRICPYDSSEIWVDVSGGLPPFTYYWTHSGETTNNTWVQPGWSTSYEVTVQDGCETYELQAHPFVEVVRPNADFSVLSTTQMENLPIFFANNSTGAETWWWDLGNGESSTDFAPGTTYIDNGTYLITLIATNDIGCTDTAIKEIRIKPEFYFYAPNAFTPNSDSYNNSYSISLIGAKELDFYIFDRWGEIIYSTSNPNFQWDGSYHGRLAEDGVYIFKCRIVGEDEEIREYSGHINLLR